MDFRSRQLFVGNDSGPTHLAAALSVPVVVLFGSSDSALWSPWKTSYRMVQNSFDCNPCPGYRCLVYNEPRCILSITSSQVKVAIDALLGDNIMQRKPETHKATCYPSSVQVPLRSPLDKAGREHWPKFAVR